MAKQARRPAVSPQPPAPRGRRPSATRREHSPTHGVVCAQDPARMTPEARLRELGAILAAGFRRQLENEGSNCLADRDQSEAACEIGAVNALENPTEETA